MSRKGLRVRIHLCYPGANHAFDLVTLGLDHYAVEAWERMQSGGLSIVWA